MAARASHPGTIVRWLRSELWMNGFSGKLGSWVGSLVKLTLLYAPHAPGTQAQTHARVRTHTKCVCAPACVCV
jgi:hypothetical protein